MSELPNTIYRRPRVLLASGHGRSTLYAHIADGLWPKPVRLGPRSVGWPRSEVIALNAARIEGRSDAEIRSLVQRLVEARRGHCQSGAAVSDDRSDQ